MRRSLRLCCHLVKPPTTPPTLFRLRVTTGTTEYLRSASCRMAMNAGTRWLLPPCSGFRLPCKVHAHAPVSAANPGHRVRVFNAVHAPLNLHARKPAMEKEQLPTLSTECVYSMLSTPSRSGMASRGALVPYTAAASARTCTATSGRRGSCGGHGWHASPTEVANAGSCDLASCRAAMSHNTDRRRCDLPELAHGPAEPWQQRFATAQWTPFPPTLSSAAAFLLSSNMDQQSMAELVSWPASRNVLTS